LKLPKKINAKAYTKYWGSLTERELREIE